MGKAINAVAKAANLPRAICHFLIGEEHKTSHRMVAGFAVMVGGVLIAKSGHHFSYDSVAVLVDMTGYGVHALGATPYIEWAMGQSTKK